MITRLSLAKGKNLTSLNQNKIRICFILSHLPQGGAERQTINLIRFLDPARFDITLLLYANREVFYREVFDLPVTIISKSEVKKGKIIKNLAGALFLRRTLRENKYDILHTLLHHNGFWVRLLAPGEYANRIVYSLRNSLGVSTFMERLSEKIFCGKGVVVTNSKSVMEQYLKLVGEKHRAKVRTIYNGIDIERFTSLSIPNSTDKIIIGNVGRQTALKNQIQILRAAKVLCMEYPAHFIIVGDSDQDSHTFNRKYIADNGLEDCVTIQGSQYDIENYYKKFNIFILSSVSESCPNALFEAMLSGCLCIVSEGANSDQFIKDGQNGFVYDGSDGMLIETVRMAVSFLKTGEATAIQENGRDYVSQKLLNGEYVKGICETL